VPPENPAVEAAPSGDQTRPSGHETTPAVGEADVPLERDVFLRTLVRELAGTLEETVGLEDAEGFVSVVGDRIGHLIDADYRDALGRRRLDRNLVADVLVDLKRRIQGDFFIVDQDDETIVLGNRACPFGEKVIGRPSMCMMTSNVFGSIAAENLGYAKVVIDEAIALGHEGCSVTVHLQPTAEAEAAQGREYFATEDRG
jgi:predicted ArsR family transcriptional regulator